MARRRPHPYGMKGKKESPGGRRRTLFQSHLSSEIFKRLLGGSTGPGNLQFNFPYDGKVFTVGKARSPTNKMRGTHAHESDLYLHKAKDNFVLVGKVYFNLGKDLLGTNIVVKHVPAKFDIKKTK